MLYEAPVYVREDKLNNISGMKAISLRDISNCLNVVFSRKLANEGKELKDNFLRAMAEREEANRSGEMTVSTLLQHSICYVMGFPQNISAIPLRWEQNPHCVKFRRATPFPTHTLTPYHLFKERIQNVLVHF